MQTPARSRLLSRKRSAGLIAALVLALIQVAPTNAGAEPVPTCNGLPATIVGTPGRDRIIGSPDDDVIVALAGDDWISGGGGNDTICGNSGSDVIHGDDGDDLLYGQGGTDDLDGGDGNDRAFGGLADDVLRGGGGDDRLFGQRGEDSVDGGDGDDRVFGGHDADFIVGGIGDDRLFGQAGNDTIAGTNGFDFLRGGAGDDALWGGLGPDRHRGGPGTDNCYYDDDDAPGNCEIFNLTHYQTLTFNPVGTGDDPTGSDFGDPYFDGAVATAHNGDWIPVSITTLTGKAPFRMTVPRSGLVQLSKYFDPRTAASGSTEIEPDSPPQVSLDLNCCIIFD